MEECDCIIPAAGSSTRMGRWKPVLPFGGSTIISTVVAEALAACARVLLVTGYRGAELAALFRGESRVVPITNERWSDGMFSSIRAACALVRTRRFFVTLGDMPWIGRSVYQALLLGPEADVLFPVHAGRRGHPVLFHERVRDAVARSDPVTGNMRSIAESFRVREMDWPDDSVLRDVDRETDLP